MSRPTRKRCGRTLKDPVSIARGLGPVRRFWRLFQQTALSPYPVPIRPAVRGGCPREWPAVAVCPGERTG